MIPFNVITLAQVSFSSLHNSIRIHGLQAKIWPHCFPLFKILHWLLTEYRKVQTPWRCLLLVYTVQLLILVQLFATPWTPALQASVHHHLPEFTQTYVHWVSDAIQSLYPLSSPSPPAFNLSQHQGLFQWVSSSHQVAKVLEFQLQHQSFQWRFRTDFL